MNGTWNSLELVKLFVSALTPILVAIIGFILNKSIKKIDQRQWTNSKILEKRLLVYDKVVPILNDLLCFHCYVGNWKELTANDIIAYKRILDKELNIYSPLFSNAVMVKYEDFITKYYQTNTGWGNDAKIMSLYSRRKEFCKTWKDSDIDLFSDEYSFQASEHSDKENEYIKDKKKAYLDLVEELSSSLEIMQSNVNMDINNPSINFYRGKRA